MTKKTILDDYTYHVIRSVGDLQKVLPVVLQDSCLGIDTETTSLKYDEQKIVSIQIVGNKHVFFSQVFDGQQYKSNILDYLRQELAKWPDKLYIMHNTPFDLAALHRVGIEWEGQVFDTMTAAHILNETRSKALKEIAAAVFGTKIVTFEEVSKLQWTDPKFIEYASHDAIFVRELYPIMLSQLQKVSQDALALRIEMPFQHVLKDMKIKGIGVSPETADKLAAQARLLEYALEKKCHEAAGLRFTEQCDLLGNRFIQSKYNFGSSQQLVDIIENKLGVEIFETTDTGAKSVGKKTKARLKNQCEFVKQLDLYGKVTKLLNGFLDPFRDFIDSDGRMRSDINNTGTVTGRPSSSDPNLFQLPKDNEDIDLNFRECFIAPDDKVMIAADFSGQELRGLADLTRDPSLLKCFARGMDLHLMVANEMFKCGIPEDDLCEKSPNYEAFKNKFKKERHIAKNGVLFPLIYGSTAVGISGNLGITVEEAQGYIDRFFDSFPMVKKAIDTCRWFVINNGYVVNKSGRRRHFEKEFGKYPNSCFRQAFNFLIQGLATDQTKLCCVKIREEFRKHPEWDAIIVLIVYDEIVVECHEKYQQIVTDTMRAKMLNSYKLSVPLEVSIGYGKNYQLCK